jgi:hypothetical protein
VQEITELAPERRGMYKLRYKFFVLPVGWDESAEDFRLPGQYMVLAVGR